MDFEQFRALSRRAEEMAGPSLLLREQLELNGSAVSKAILDAKQHASLASEFITGLGGPQRILELSKGVQHWQRNERLRETVEGSTSAMARAAQGHIDSLTMRSAMGYIDSPSVRGAMEHLGSDAMRAARGLTDSSTMTAARELAERAHAIAMPSALAGFHTPLQSMAERLSLLDPAWMTHDSVALDAFARSTAMSDAIALSTQVDRGLIDAARAFSTTRMPDLGSLAAHRAFLDASGLWLPRWPRTRLLTTAEKRRRFRRRLQRNAEPPHVKRAKSLVHQYELVMREIIDAAMAATYGEDWTRERLPECGCKTLLRRAEARGGDPLDHADYAHYRQIMSHPDHYADVFCTAFDDPETLAELIDDAGRLRARSHHARDFSPDDLRDLRVVWRTVEAGLLALTDDFAFDQFG